MKFYTLYTLLNAAAGSDMLSAFETSVNSVKTDFMAMAGKALPVGLGIMSTTLVIALAVKFFKGLAKK